MSRISASRLLSNLDELATIGSLEHAGVQRLAFSDLDLEGRSWVVNRLKKLGVETRIDAIGNLFGVWNAEADGPGLMIGSHTDTVGRAGRYDGSLGVLAALEVLETLSESGERPARPIILASFVNEEGVRFMPDMMGSLYHVGSLSLSDARSAADADGITVGEECDRLAYTGSATIDDLSVDTFLELHIEQGPLLEREGIDIGVVTGVQGLSWWEVTVKGSSNHAGTTPMNLRDDAGLKASKLMTALRTLPNRIPDLRLTIGSVRYHPNLVNVIPDTVTFTVDMRHPSEEKLIHAENYLSDLLSDTGAQRDDPSRTPGSEARSDVSFKSLARVSPCDFASEVVKAVEQAADDAGLTRMRMISGAGHDAQILHRRYRSGMIFIPSRGGISHNPEEYSEPRHLVGGANVLLQAVLRLSS